MSKISEESAIRILSGDLSGTPEQANEAVRMGAEAIDKINTIKKYIKAKRLQKEITPELMDYIIRILWDEL